MQNLIQSNVFFFITSIAVVVVTIFVLVILWYIVRILKNIKDVSDIFKKESFSVFNDLSAFSIKVKKFLQFFNIKYDKEKLTRMKAKIKK